MSYQITPVPNLHVPWNDDLLFPGVENFRCSRSFSIGCRNAGTVSWITGIVPVRVLHHEEAILSGDRSCIDPW